MNTYSTPSASKNLRLIEQLLFSRDFIVEPYKQIDDSVIHIKGTAWEWLVPYWAKGEAEIRQGAELKKKKAKEFAERITEGGIFQAGAAEWHRDRSKLSGVPGWGGLAQLGVARATTDRRKKKTKDGSR